MSTIMPSRFISRMICRPKSVNPLCSGLMPSKLPAESAQLV